MKTISLNGVNVYPFTSEEQLLKMSTREFLWLSMPRKFCMPPRKPEVLSTATWAIVMVRER